MKKNKSAQLLAIRSHRAQKKKYPDYSAEMRRRGSFRKLVVRSETPNDIIIKTNK